MVTKIIMGFFYVSENGESLGHKVIGAVFIIHQAELI